MYCYCILSSLCFCSSRSLGVAAFTVQVFCLAVLGLPLSGLLAVSHPHKSVRELSRPHQGRERDWMGSPCTPTCLCCRCTLPGHCLRLLQLKSYLGGGTWTRGGSRTLVYLAICLLAEAAEMGSMTTLEAWEWFKQVLKKKCSTWSSYSCTVYSPVTDTFHPGASQRMKGIWSKKKRGGKELPVELEFLAKALRATFKQRSLERLPAQWILLFLTPTTLILLNTLISTTDTKLFMLQKDRNARILPGWNIGIKIYLKNYYLAGEKEGRKNCMYLLVTCTNMWTKEAGCELHLLPTRMLLCKVSTQLGFAISPESLMCKVLLVG